jgi:hypothetical protein
VCRPDEAGDRAVVIPVPRHPSDLRISFEVPNSKSIRSLTERQNKVSVEIAEGRNDTLTTAGKKIP